MAFRKIKYTMRLGIQLFLIITVVSLLIIIFSTVDRNTYSAIGKLNPIYLLIILFLFIASLVLDAFKLKLLTKITEENIGIKNSIFATLGNIFISAITPSGGGGGAVQVYIMYLAGVSPGKGTAVTLLKFGLNYFSLALMTPLIILFNPSIFKNILFSSLIFYATIFSIILIIFFLYAIYKPKYFKILITAILNFLNKIKLISKNFKNSILKKIIREIDIFSSVSTSGIKRHKYLLVYAEITTLIIIIMQYSIAPLILKGLGVVKPHFYLSIFLQVVLHFLTYAVPTPGGSGAVEFGFKILFDSIVKQTNIIGVYVLLWRFFSSYLWIALGAFVVLKIFDIHELKKLPRK